MTKPDRFARMVAKLNTYGNQSQPGIDPTVVVKLLKAEHRRVVRMVKGLRYQYAHEWDGVVKSYKDACDEILRRLDG